MRFSSVIEAITQSIQKFGIIRNETVFESELDFIVSKMETVKVEVEDNWDILQSNYSKLKYLSELINFYNLPTDGKFVESFSKFMESTDKQTKYYLKEVIWDYEDDYKEETSLIKEILEYSVNQTDNFEKLNSVLAAYKILVNIVEDIRGEKCETILDDDFLETFDQSSKRQRV
jgi:hypothetical protein